jgi:hypothetical protein
MGPRAAVLVLVALAPVGVAALAGGCGSQVMVGGPEDDPAEGGGGYVFLDAGHGGKDSGKPPPDGDLPDYEDPGCPGKPPPMEDFQCDPYHQHNGDCLPDEGCYIYVQYPDEPCGQEIYGSYCYAAGWGQQGDACGGGFDCGAGLVCVITGSGTQCVQLCSLTGPNQCPPGMVCETIDVVGFGGCL